MNRAQFQVTADHQGNLRVAGGWVVQHKTGVSIQVAGYDGGRVADAEALADGDEWPALPTADGFFVGGSGRNITVTGLTAGTLVPVGFYRPIEGGNYRAVIGIGEILVTGSAAVIHDGTDDVATLASWTVVPVGTYVATAYGEATYNGSVAFDLTAADEAGDAGMPSATVVVTGGTFQEGAYSAAALEIYASDVDGDFTIEVDGSGSADLRYLGTAMATRASGPPDDPRGIYVATATGETDFHGGEAWQAIVGLGRVAPVAGWVYLSITESSGVLTAVGGPFFAASLPAPAGEVYAFPLAYCDGINPPEQIHAGMVPNP